MAASGGGGVVGSKQAMLAALMVVAMAAAAVTPAAGFISGKTWRAVRRANRVGGPFVGLVVPNAYEMDPSLRTPASSPEATSPSWTFKVVVFFFFFMFRFGTIGGQSVVMVMTGLSMLNAGLTTQLLLSLFNVKGIVHWGIAGSANEDLQIGDVTIPEYWAHLSLWNWQRYGDGPANELPLEAAGDYTRKFGFLNFSDYTVGQGNKTNTLNSIWYQPEEIFPISGTPEQRQHAFWVPVSKRYYDLAGKLETLKLPACVNGTTTRCLPRPPKVTRVPRGCSANVYTDNASYRQFIRNHFECTPVEMESAAVALVAHQLGVPFVTIRSLSDLAGGGSSLSNEAATFLAMAAQNAVDVMLKFVPLLGAADEHDDR
nr:unnamed protein product [Digitaria exilis]